ncbi:hypothetical protein Q9L58_000538 [Maublancomyces gigas]|uniref:Uncharacterized protein n=1 Tax=Discina gigas TaxID=1032678 RepID=A0ABR3GWC1_9PEZI
MIVAVGPEGHPKLENATTEALFRVFRIEMQRWEGERRAEIEKATEVQQELEREIAQIRAEQKKSEAERADEREKERVEMQRWEGERRAEIEKATEVQQELEREIAQIRAEQKKSEAERADEREKERVEMQRWADVRKKEHAEMRHIEEAKCVVQAKHVVQEGPTADQQELEAKLADLQQDQTLAEMNRRHRHSQSVLGEFTSSIEQSRVAQQSLIQAVVGIEEWRATINSLHL